MVRNSRPPINIPLLDNNQALLIELGIGLIIALLISIYFYKKQLAISKNQDKLLGQVNTLVGRIEGLTTEQSKIAKIIEARRQNRIRWFKHTSLKLLKSIEERYRKLSEAVDNYVLDDGEANRKMVESIARISLDFTFKNAFEVIVNRDLKIAEEYLENTWLIAKLPDVMPIVAGGFAVATQPMVDVLNIREEIKESLKYLDEIITQIESERD